MKVAVFYEKPWEGNGDITKRINRIIKTAEKTDRKK